MRKILFTILGLISFINLSFAESSWCSKKEAIKLEEKKDVVVLVHGYGRSASAMWKMQDYLEEAGYQVLNIGYGSMTQDISAIKREFRLKVDPIIEASRVKNLRTHFVGHSMGGLMIRSYLGEKQVDNLGQVVLLGSPSKGTPIADYFSEKWYGFLGGPALKSLGTVNSKFLSSLEAPYYPLGVIAGDVKRPGREDLLPGKDDGVVPLKSTKVEGMKDHIVLPVGHSMMRYSFPVAKQAIYFLKHGKFWRIKG